MLSDQQFTAQADFMKAISHPTRLQIIELLRCGEKCVCEIYPALDLGQTNVSRHLAILKREGLVQSRKEGLKVIYWTADQRIYEILDLCSQMVRQIWDQKAEMAR